MVSIKLFNTWDEICLGLYIHKAWKVNTEELFSEEFKEEFTQFNEEWEESTRIVIGFLIFGIDIII